MPNSSPIISVVMSVFNHQHYVADAIESIINQTFRDLEFIIIDDGSTDESLSVIRKYEKLDSRIIVISHKNIGLTKSLNIAIQSSSGSYVARQDADDKSALNRLERQLNVIQTYKLDLVASRAFKDSHVVPNSFLLNFNSHNILKAGNIFIHGTFLVKKSLFDIKMYDEKYIFAQDFKFILDVIRFDCKIGYILEPLYFLNNIETSISNTKKYEQDRFVSNALTSFFGSDKYFLLVNKCNHHLRSIFKLVVILYLYLNSKNNEFKVIK